MSLYTPLVPYSIGVKFDMVTVQSRGCSERLVVVGLQTKCLWNAHMKYEIGRLIVHEPDQ